MTVQGLGFFSVKLMDFHSMQLKVVPSMKIVSERRYGMLDCSQMASVESSSILETNQFLGISDKASFDSQKLIP